MPEQISVVIPNWNGAGWLEACLESLAKQTFTDFKVYVVDNASEDDSVALLEASYPEVQIIRNAENLGFAGGMNCGMRVAEGQLIVALNNDVEVHPKWLETMNAVMESYPEAGSGASQLMDFKDRHIIDSLGDGFLPVGLSFKAGAGCTYPAEGIPVSKIQSPCAAASVYRKTMLDDIGLFDEDFFAYMEDIDLGLRAQRAGYDSIFIPGAIVYHLGSATSGGTASAFSIQHSVRNTYAVILKNVPAALLPVYLFLTVAFHGLALVLSFIPGRAEFLSKHRGSVLKGLWLALRETPKNLRKRRKIKPLHRRGTSNFIKTTWHGWRLFTANLR